MPVFNMAGQKGTTSPLWRLDFWILSHLMQDDTRGHLRQTSLFAPIPTQHIPCGNHPAPAICYFHHTWPRSISSLLLFPLFASQLSALSMYLPNFAQIISHIKLRCHSTFIPLHFGMTLPSLLPPFPLSQPSVAIKRSIKTGVASFPARGMGGG